MTATALLVVAGCGEGEGVSKGAMVTAYVAAPLCAEAKRELGRDGGQAGEVRVRVSCLVAERSAGKLSLAKIGAGARRATEDSTTIAYITTRDPVAVRFSETILEEAGIAQLSTRSGAAGMSKLLHAVGEAGDASNLRESVDKSLGSG